MALLFKIILKKIISPQKERIVPCIWTHNVPRNPRLACIAALSVTVHLSLSFLYNRVGHPCSIAVVLNRESLDLIGKELLMFEVYLFKGGIGVKK